ncbi:MAG: M48 family metallopeptidase [Planctomycetes bacterium]|nr:M48 family metallopeptidase [Planctomycetota bacterium]
MAGFFYNLGRRLGPTVRKGQWLWQSAAGSEKDAIEAEAKVGRDLAETIVREIGLSEDASITSEIDAMGARLADRVKNRHRSFRTRVLAGGPPNAFALPGGFLFITRELIELAEGDADALAFVIGHEMGHVIRQHPVERIMTDAVVGAAVRALPTARLAGGWIQSAGARLLTSAYSQDREFEADALGVALAEAAGFDAIGSVRLLQRLADTTRGSSRPLAEYFATHPPIEDRIHQLRRRR